MGYNLIKDFLPSCITIITAFIAALLALRIWRKQLIEKEKRDLAKEILKSAYEVADIIKHMRRDVIYPSEYNSRVKDQNESSELTHYLDRAYVPIDRYNKNIGVFNKLRSLKYDYIIIFGKEGVTLMDEVLGIAYKIILTAQASLSSSDDIELMKQNEEFIWCHNENDKISKTLNSALNKIEETCYKYIKIL